MKPLVFVAALAFAIASPTASAADSSAPDFVLHEWGTFTSVSGSDGRLLPGLQTEEESLPLFVASHAGMENRGRFGGKGFSRPLSGVTIKMETPVIYFYSKEAFAAQVSVGFRGGSISQWFPRRSGGETPPPVMFDERTRQLVSGAIDFAARRYDGSIAWDLRVEPVGDDASARIFKPGETTNWLYPRQTDSALVTTANGDTEKYLFYRGVGNFTPSVVFTMTDSETLRVENRGEAAVPDGLVFEQRKDGTARFILLGALAGAARTSVNLAQCTPTSAWSQAVYDAMVRPLVAAGLYRKEADAMLQTWWQSYFARPGLRVFWIVPAVTTDAILPLTVKPAPREQVRVLVARTEVLSPAFEQQLVREFATPQGTDSWRADRYFAAYAARVQALAAK